MSQTSVSAAPKPCAPSERNCSSYSTHASSTAWRTSAAMIGKISNVWAITIAGGVKSNPSDPSGPARESSRYTTNPTTTGGRPINAFIATSTA